MGFSARSANEAGNGSTAAKQKGNNLEGLKDFDLKGKARNWP